jgi:nucleotide-binding universal stress UspA family protein
MTVRYNTILAAVDGSDVSKRAFRKAVLLAKDHNARLLLVHIIETRTTVTMGHFNQTILQDNEKSAIAMLHEYKELAKKEGVKDVKEILDHGSPKVKIAKDVAKQHNVDLIVAGATGLNAVEHFLIGSVSEQITRHAACDVLIVRTETKDN